MNVLLIDAYHPDDANSEVATIAKKALERNGHNVRYIGLHASGFNPFMSADERAAYHTSQPLLFAETRTSAEAITAADALLLCYPTMAFMVPAILKGWIERVLVPGVAITFDSKGKVAPNLGNLRRLGVATTTPHDRRAIWRARNLARRTTMWTLRLNCNRLCSRTYVSVPRGSVEAHRIEKAFARW